MSQLRIGLLFTFLTFSLAQCNQPPAPTAASGNVTLEIQGQPAKQASVIGGATVLDLMEKLRADGQLDFQSTGSGEMAMIDSLGGQKNEGMGDTKRNWLFAHNGKLSAQGIGQLKLNANDRITWCFVLWKDRDSCK